MQENYINVAAEGLRILKRIFIGMEGLQDGQVHTCRRIHDLYYRKHYGKVIQPVAVAILQDLRHDSA